MTSVLVDDELEARIATVLRRMALLSEAPAASLGQGPDRTESYRTERLRREHKVPQRPARPQPSGKSAPPRGASLSEKLCGLPRKDLCLADFYAWQFGQVKEIARRRLLCFLAERELDRRMRRQPQRLHEDPDERAKRILAMYEGVSALEAAVFEDCSETWIRKLRREHDHDPLLGGGTVAA